MYSKNEFKHLLLIIIIFIAACIETDIYLPAFPDMMNWFSTTESAIQGLLTWNFIGICLSGPFYGPLSDAFGRKKPLIVALIFFLAGSILTLCAQTFDQMLFGRILQGIGSGGCFTLGTAIIFDTFQKEKAITALTSLNTIIPLIMAGAPMLGGFLNNNFGFRSNFLTIVLFVLLSLILCLFLFEEPLSKDKRAPFDLATILRDFKKVLLSLAFWQITLVLSLLFGGYIAFLSGSTVLFMVEFGMSKIVFPFIQAAVLGGWVAGSLLLKRSLASLGPLKVKRFGILLCIIGALELVVAAWLTPENPYLHTLGMVLYAFGANWVVGLYFPEGMELFPEIKGIASSLLTSARLLLSAWIIGMTSALYNGTIYPLAAVIIGTVVLMLPTLFYYEKRKVNSSAETA
ncbi:MAG: MFS transporter [Rhabdochlamydiaceae bacterium]|nr:MFS transporter [Rhabdochlamydiaceae bacterium]